MQQRLLALLALAAAAAALVVRPAGSAEAVFRVAEETPRRASVGNLWKSLGGSGDAGGGGSFKVVPRSPYFTVDEVGNVRVDSPIDREDPAACPSASETVACVVEFNVFRGAARVSIVRVTIDDINDNAPVFKEPEKILFVEEGDTSFRHPLDLATDADIGDNGMATAGSRHFLREDAGGGCCDKETGCQCALSEAEVRAMEPHYGRLCGGGGGGGGHQFALTTFSHAGSACDLRPQLMEIRNEVVINQQDLDGDSADSGRGGSEDDHATHHLFGLATRPGLHHHHHHHHLQQPGAASMSGLNGSGATLPRRIVSPTPPVSNGGAGGQQHQQHQILLHQHHQQQQQQPQQHLLPLPQLMMKQPARHQQYLGIPEEDLQSSSVGSGGVGEVGNGFLPPPLPPHGVELRGGAGVSRLNSPAFQHQQQHQQQQHQQQQHQQPSGGFSTLSMRPPHSPQLAQFQPPRASPQFGVGGGGGGLGDADGGSCGSGGSGAQRIC